MKHDVKSPSARKTSPAVACGMCERRAHEFGKTVREVCADFKAKYGGHL